MIPRRRLFVLAGQTAAAAALGAFTPACGFFKSPASGPIAAGNVRDVKVGYFDFVKDHPVILGRDDAGLYAMTAICTHWGCDIHKDGKVEATGVSCSCHGLRFDKTGKVVEGPAEKPLDHYKVDVAPNGEITIAAGTIVDAAARTVVSAPAPAPAV